LTHPVYASLDHPLFGFAEKRGFEVLFVILSVAKDLLFDMLICD
jgi:hypothetical protein